MLFKSKQDEKTIQRAQQMYGKGINRGLAGFAPKSNKKHQAAATRQTEADHVWVTTTTLIPGRDYSLIDAVFGVATWVDPDVESDNHLTAGGEVAELTTAASKVRQLALDRLRAAAKKLHADAVVAMKFAETVATVNGRSLHTVTSSGTAVKFE